MSTKFTDDEWLLILSVQLFWIELSVCYCSKSAGEGQGLAEKKRKGNQRGLGILPYGNFIIRTVGKYGEIWTIVLAKFFRQYGF